MEPTELIANDEEHAVRLLGILDLRQELGGKPEGESNLGRLIEVGLQDMPGKILETNDGSERENRLVEDEEALEDLELLLVGDTTTDLVVELFI